MMGAIKRVVEGYGFGRIGRVELDVLSNKVIEVAQTNNKQKKNDA